MPQQVEPAFPRRDDEPTPEQLASRLNWLDRALLKEPCGLTVLRVSPVHIQRSLLHLLDLGLLEHVRTPLGDAVLKVLPEQP